jgi:hypothetical protein
LDCFLPKDDPRSELEDITDRFDTTFWMGDCESGWSIVTDDVVNFRLDLTRLHAEWLIEQKSTSIIAEYGLADGICRI